eukprot:TRINITY_DN34904_c0_g1_i1.p1 TRINITY_DN34904_c0_g1~~TRINITY_DN34904_c0_g1_i1.p1  ORF type:complete len:1299 (+),score=160.39 TRINITY_DN34904_c0_g1_i1:40-3897(+)
MASSSPLLPLGVTSPEIMPVSSPVAEGGGDAGGGSAQAPHGRHGDSTSSAQYASSSMDHASATPSSRRLSECGELTAFTGERPSCSKEICRTTRTRRGSTGIKGKQHDETMENSFIFQSCEPSVPSSSYITDGNTQPARVELEIMGTHKVEVVEVDRDWGYRLDLSSDSDNSIEVGRSPVHRRRRADSSVHGASADRAAGGVSSHRDHASVGGEGDVGAGKIRYAKGYDAPAVLPKIPGGGREGEGVGIMEVSDDWAGAAALLDSEDTIVGDSRPNVGGKQPFRPSQAEKPLAAPLLLAAEEPAATTEPARARRNSLDVTEPSRSTTRFWQKCCCRNFISRTRFCLSVLMHISDFTLRSVCLGIFVKEGRTVVWACLLPLQIIGAVVSTYVTFHDNDVILTLHWLGRRWPRLRCLFALATCIFLGIFELIQMKRAWARQLTQADVLTDMADGSGEASGQVGAVEGADRIMPVAAISGIPWLMVVWYASMYEEANRSSLELNILRVTTFVVGCVVSLGIVDIDTKVSAFVSERYHLDPRIRGPHAGHLQWLYPAVHITFRVTEVCLRVKVIIGCIVLCHSEPRLTVAFMVCLIFDYLVGVLILAKNSPDPEFATVHLVAGLMVLMSDVAYFVDQPHFAVPARRISKLYFIWRLMTCLVYMMTCTVVYWGTFETLFDESHHFILCICLFVVHYALKFSPAIRRRGDDLHTCAFGNKVKEMRKLLTPGSDGQVLDVNATTKDAEGMTPLMCATKSGNLGVLELLVSEGANMNATNHCGDTALHYAARFHQVDACNFLLANGADPQHPNTKGVKPQELVTPGGGRHSNAAYADTLTRMLNGGWVPSIHEGFLDSTSYHSPRPVGKRHYSVTAAPAADTQLRGLFPDAAEDGSPSPLVLHSVSALSIAVAVGPLANRIINRQDAFAGGVPLLALRPVRALGKGGFGRVIEVEVPANNAGILRRHADPRRFALKLQLKREGRQARTEVLALRRADHPFIVRLEKAFQTPRFFALLLELCPTDLNRLLCEPNVDGCCPGLSADRVAKYMGQVLLALVHLHKTDIVFRDVKPENILLSSRDTAKLTDFGLAKEVSPAERLGMCGTYGYLAPELLSLRYEDSDSQDSETFRSDRSLNPYKMDAYSFGVTLQVALLGEDGARRKEFNKKGAVMLPLYLSESDNVELLRQLKKIGRLSPQSHSLLVDKLLPHDPALRCMLQDVNNDDFFLSELGCDDLEGYLMANRNTSCVSLGSNGSRRPSRFSVSSTVGHWFHSGPAPTTTHSGPVPTTVHNSV